MYPHTHLVILIFFLFFPLFVSSCLMGSLTVVYQVRPVWGPWVQVLSLIACPPPACSLGSPLSTFQTTLIITPLGPACSRHLRSLAGRFVSPPLIAPPAQCSILPPFFFPEHPPPWSSPWAEPATASRASCKGPQLPSHRAQEPQLLLRATLTGSTPPEAAHPAARLPQDQSDHLDYICSHCVLS